MKHVNFESKSFKIGKKVVGFQKIRLTTLEENGPQTFSRSKIWIMAACASKLGIVGEVYSELPGLQVWVTGLENILFKLTLTEQQILKYKNFFKKFRFFRAI